MPECITLVTAIVYWNEIILQLFLKLLIIVCDLLGNVGQFICIIRLMLDLWLLVGYWYNNVLNVYASLSLMQQSSDYAASKTSIYSLYSKGANNNAVSLDNNEDDNDRDNDFGNGS